MVTSTPVIQLAVIGQQVNAPTVCTTLPDGSVKSVLMDTLEMQQPKVAQVGELAIVSVCLSGWLGGWLSVAVQIAVCLNVCLSPSLSVFLTVLLLLHLGRLSV